MKLFPVITCEHAGNIVPENYANLFRGADELLATHRGYDLGASDVAIALSARLKAPLYTCRTTRLLIEPNRSLGHPHLFSEFTRSLSSLEKEVLISTVYNNYRARVIETIEQIPKPVLHLSIHSFTPTWDDVPRDVDIGLLFDPDRKLESKCCVAMREQLEKSLWGYRVRFNEPYRGIDDGFTTYLRTKFSDEVYAGIEIEFNQRFVGTDDVEKITDALTHSVQEIF